MSSQPPRNRQELYDRIRAGSKDEVVLEEMVRLGFWPARSERPGDPVDVMHRRNELQAELRALTTEQTRLGNLEAMKRELRKRRLEESRRKQQETKERRERERLARAAAWKERKGKELLFLGRGVSGGLSERTPDEAKLTRLGLPVLATPEVLAQALGLSVGKLRALCFTRTASTTSHYVRFQLPKKTGGTRLISAPLPRLKAAQAWVLENILEKVPVHDAAHGFRAGRSIVTNARPHVGAGVVVNLDLKDFFPSVLYPRVKGVFAKLGYSEATATVLALLCTEPDVEEVELDGQRFFVAQGGRRLPQGAPTSPALTNILCRRLDRRLSGAARKLGFVYTRYADDLTFSAHGPGPHDAGELLRFVRWLVGEEDFTPHPDKTRVLRRGRQQEVTGVVVNDKPGVDRETLKRFRALLHQLEKSGPEGKRWGNSGDVIASAVGYANYVAMVDPVKGAALQRKARALEARYGRRPSPPPRAKVAKGGAQAGGSAPASSSAPAQAPETPAVAPPAPAATPDSGQKPTEPPKKKWWKLF
ncbi:reverse transcriptase (RNA-dependent DNA polymerase) [Archangium gephyra]|uniref:RNA-directed DNA polymerase n=1 Tax=Archangium gephyra TaxID=48 RepID=A0AAC8QI32_9BACT|nr:reverse transcriptase family protein [Archangium gephyra]AKJ07416.1 Retron-type RNA-directed DNA polymerase [Archangium gephyra]REG26813.1 reverse transcriptase (RNA-dependent DNA polymerase) [Archangium gephyra]